MEKATSIPHQHQRLHHQLWHWWIPEADRQDLETQRPTDFEDSQLHLTPCHRQPFPPSRRTTPTEPHHVHQLGDTPHPSRPHRPGLQSPRILPVRPQRHFPQTVLGHCPSITPSPFPLPQPSLQKGCQCRTTGSPHSAPMPGDKGDIYMPMSCLAIYRLFAPQDHKGNKLLKPKQCLVVKASGPCLDLDINLARSLQHRDRPEFHYYLYLMEWPEDATDDLLSTLKVQTERQILWLQLSALKRDFWQTTPDLTRAFAGQSTRLYCFPTSTKFAWRCSKTPWHHRRLSSHYHRMVQPFTTPLSEGVPAEHYDHTDPSIYTPSNAHILTNFTQNSARASDSWDTCAQDSIACADWPEYTEPSSLEDLRIHNRQYIHKKVQHNHTDPHWEMMANEIATEVQQGRMAGPFRAPEWLKSDTVPLTLHEHANKLFLLPHHDPIIDCPCFQHRTNRIRRPIQDPAGRRLETLWTQQSLAYRQLPLDDPSPFDTSGPYLVAPSCTTLWISRQCVGIQPLWRHADSHCPRYCMRSSSALCRRLWIHRTLDPGRIWLYHFQTSEPPARFPHETFQTTTTWTLTPNTRWPTKYKNTYKHNRWHQNKPANSQVNVLSPLHTFSGKSEGQHYEPYTTKPFPTTTTSRHIHWAHWQHYTTSYNIVHLAEYPFDQHQTNAPSFTRTSFTRWWQTTSITPTTWRPRPDQTFIGDFKTVSVQRHRTTQTSQTLCQQQSIHILPRSLGSHHHTSTCPTTPNTHLHTIMRQRCSHTCNHQRLRQAHATEQSTRSTLDLAQQTQPQTDPTQSPYTRQHRWPIQQRRFLYCHTITVAHPRTTD